LELPTGKADHTRQIDAVILSEDGLGIIDFKHALGEFTPSLDDRPWEYANGKTVASGSRNNPNPFRQMEGQREALYLKFAELVRHVNEAELPKPFREHATRKLKSKKSNKHFYHFDIAARCVLTGTRFDMPHYKREKHQRWFDIIWMEETPEFAKTLSFNKGLRLSQPLIRAVIDDLLGLSPWIELETLYRKPYGYLNRTDADMSVPLLSAMVTVGRSSDLDVRAPKERKHVSRRHAIIRQMPGGVILQDTDSTHGTWVNGVRLDSGIERRLVHNDTITFGRLIDGAPSVHSVQFRYVEAGQMEAFDVEETMGFPLDTSWFGEE
ncbi:MAG: FHA domain-containing protein, partial [Chloroflexota bacterium]